MTLTSKTMIMRTKDKHPNIHYTTKTIKSLECIVCGAEIKISDIDTESHKFEELCWDHGVIEKMYANYGSIHDGDIFYVALCDDCIDKKKEQGRILVINNYMGLQLDIKEENKHFERKLKMKNLSDKEE